jgi:hypothetical protein
MHEVRLAAIAPRLAGIIVASIATSRGFCAEPPLPPAAEAVRKYLLEAEYPELFDDAQYRVRIENMVVADVDNDGRKEVVVHYLPHYRQSATIVLFRISDEFEVSRITEGLAPGPLQPLTGDYLDSHTLGLAVDFTIDDEKTDAKTRQTFVELALEQFGGLVTYANFYHADSRSGHAAYIDLTQLRNPPAASNCENFEFATVREIAVGPLKGRTENLLAAWVGEEIYLYAIKGVRNNGLLDKKIWIRPVPKDFQGFVPGKGLTYRTKSGAEQVLEAEPE